jgi:hypothetical protein
MSQTDPGEVHNYGVYRHYKNKLYLVLGVGEHTETGEVVVVYVPLYEQPSGSLPLRVRPLGGPEGFFGTAMVDGRSMPRFTYIGTRTIELPKPTEEGVRE